MIIIFISGALFTNLVTKYFTKGFKRAKQLKQSVALICPDRSLQSLGALSADSAPPPLVFSQACRTLPDFQSGFIREAFSAAGYTVAVSYGLHLSQQRD